MAPKGPYGMADLDAGAVARYQHPMRRQLSQTEANLSGAPTDAGRVLRAVVPYLWPAGRADLRWRVVAALVLLVLAKLVAVATPLSYKYAVDTVAGDAPPLAVGAVGLVLVYAMARLLSTAFQQLRDAVFARVGQHALRALAVETFTHIHRLSLRYHMARKTGSLSRVIERGIKGIAFLLRFLVFSIGPLVLELGMIAVILTVAFGPAYLGIVGLTVLAYILFTFRVTEWRVRIRKRMNDQDADANQKAIDSLLNFETVKYFGAEPRESARYDRAMAGYQAAAIDTARSLAIMNTGQALIINAGLVAVLILAARGVGQGALSVGDFVMVNAYMMQIMMPLNFLGTIYREIRQALIDMGDMFDLLALPPELRDAPGAPALQVPQGRITFDRVAFAYDPQRPILSDFDLEVAPGQTVAIVGSSGAGKSTIGRLLFRFYDVTGGAIRIDGQDLRAVTQDSLHAAIGVVPQDTVLFNDTIGYNIGYGRAGAADAEIRAAAQAAHIHAFIESLPQGYDTQVGERGLKLSGGEKQRVGIARTLLKDPPILLLDEATSALDTRTEQKIQAELRQMGAGRTVVTIAHRLSTIADADKIVVLEQGRIVETGTHEALWAAQGRYAQLWRSQNAEARGA